MARATIDRGVQTTPYPGFNSYEDIHAFALSNLPRDADGNEYVPDSDGLEELKIPTDRWRGRLWRATVPTPRYPGTFALYRELRTHRPGEELPMLEEICLQERVRKEYLRRLKEGLVPVPDTGLRYALRSYSVVSARIGQ